MLVDTKGVILAKFGSIQNILAKGIQKTDKRRTQSKDKS